MARDAGRRRFRSQDLRGAGAAIGTAIAGIRVSLRTARGRTNDEAQAAITPLPVDTHPLFNPTLNYVHFLLATVVPVMPQLTVVTVTAYSVGDDVETAARTRVSTGPGGGLGAFLFAKTMPYTFLFLSMPGLSDIVVFGVLGTPLRGDLLTSATAAILSTARRKLRPRAG